MEVLEILDEADQEFSAVMNGRRVSFRLRYNAHLDRWMFDLRIDDAPVLNGRRIVTGIDLLRGLGLGIGAIFAFSPSGAAPGRRSLPTGTVRLYTVTPAEVKLAG